MPSASSRPQLALGLHCALLVAVIALAELAPRPGLAALYLPLAVADRHPTALAWALRNGASLNGPGPYGGLILTSPPADFGARALREGALAIAIPSFLCQPTEPRPHG